MDSGLVRELRAAGCVFAEDEARVLRASARDDATLAAMLARRVGGEPLEHVVGWTDVDGLRLEVGAGVFVPRRRTVHVARVAASVAPQRGSVLDLCCGAGPVAALLATARPDLLLHAADVDPGAVGWARRNLLHRGVQVHLGDLFGALPEHLAGRFDVVVANAPYVPSGDLATMPVEARDHEPRAALDGGDDGAALHRRIALEADPWLRPGGSIVVETGGPTTAATSEAMRAAGWRTTVLLDDDLRATAVVASR